MASKNIKPGRGTILIAQPFLNEDYFQRSVILLAEHNAEGTFGLVINKPLDVKLNDILPQFPDFTAGVYVGGPVQTESVFFIHSAGEKIPQSMPILDDLVWGGDIGVVEDLIHRGELAPEQIRFFLGYSGWSPQQLEQEIAQHTWVVSRAGASVLLNAAPSQLWQKMVRRLGPEYAEWVIYPTDPSLN